MEQSENKNTRLADELAVCSERFSGNFRATGRRKLVSFAPEALVRAPFSSLEPSASW